MKKFSVFFAAVLTAALIVCAVIPLFAADTETSMNSLFEYTLDSNKKATIVAYNGKETTVSINKIDGRYTVVAIGTGAFAGNTAIKEIELSGNVKKIENGAFAGCTALEKVSFVKGGLEEIGTDAFYGCTALKELSFPDTLTAIGESAFSGCSAFAFDISRLSSLSSVGAHAFYNAATKAEPFSVTIPASLTDIGYSAFAGCTKINAFFAEAGNAAYTAENGVLFTDGGKKLLSYPIGKTDESKSYTVPSGVTAIGEGAFSYAPLEKIELSSDITEIGGSAFYASSVEEIILPASLKTIGSFAFCSTPIAKAEIPAGVSLIFVFIFIGMAFGGGVSLWWFALAIGLIAAAFPILWQFLG